MLGDDREATRRAVAAHWTGKSTATSDLHYLIVNARLRGASPPDLTPEGRRGPLPARRQARRQAGADQADVERPRGRGRRVAGEVRPRLVDALIARPDFATPGHAGMGGADRAAGAGEGRRGVPPGRRVDPEFDLSGPVLEVARRAPAVADQAGPPRPLGRARRQGRRPDPPRRRARGRRSRQVPRGARLDLSRDVAACLAALEALPPSRKPADLVPALRLLRRLASDAKAGPLRTAARRLDRPRAGRAEPRARAGRARRRSWRDYGATSTRSPAVIPTSPRAPDRAGDDDPAAWAATMARVDWNAGDTGRGASVFRSRQCASCHEGATAIGPDLAGRRPPALARRPLRVDRRPVPRRRPGLSAGRRRDDRRPRDHRHPRLRVGRRADRPDRPRRRSSGWTARRSPRDGPGTTSLMPAGLLRGAERRRSWPTSMRI